mmetsp:Transcript_29392/g.50105  ORF Transcript_29392/g.50105 Transcript_29392/m.50105 type:complete len:124 (-) Transcript_29392:1853-2224(-)
MMRRMRPHHLGIASVVVSIMTLSHATSNSLALESDTTNNNDHQRRINLRQGALSHNFRTGAEQASPQLSYCLYSASSSEDCSKKEGCVWCKEPLYGLCLTKELAKKMSFLPFLTCSNQTLAII